MRTNIVDCGHLHKTCSSVCKSCEELLLALNWHIFFVGLQPVRVYIDDMDAKMKGCLKIWAGDYENGTLVAVFHSKPKMAVDQILARQVSMAFSTDGNTTGYGFKIIYGKYQALNSLLLWFGPCINDTFMKMKPIE